MTAELAVEHALGPETVDDWLVADHPDDGSRLELILGFFQVTPAPSGMHQNAAGELYVALRSAIRTAGRSDLRALPAVGVKLSTPFRTALIPDVVVVNADIDRVSFEPEDVLLAVEVWSPGNSREERVTKMAAYAAAGIPFVWTVEQPPGKPARFWGYHLVGTGYREEVYAGNGETVKAPAPIPVEVDTSELR